MSKNVCYFAEILNSACNRRIHTTETYTNPKALHEELRDHLDEIGSLIEESDDEVCYLGEKEYKPGKEFNDTWECWDFNRKTLSEWVELAIANGSYFGPIAEIRIIKRKLHEKYRSRQKRLPADTGLRYRMSDS